MGDNLPRCKKHGTKLVQFCPTCRGARANRKTPARMAQLAQARAAKAAKRAKGDSPMVKVFLARADEENGCEECWSDLLDDMKREKLPDPMGLDMFRAPVAWRGRRCPHGAPAFAPTILLPAGLRAPKRAKGDPS